MSQAMKTQLDKLEKTTSSQQPQLFILVDGEQPPADARPVDIFINVTAAQYERMKEIEARVIDRLKPSS